MFTNSPPVLEDGTPNNSTLHIEALLHFEQTCVVNNGIRNEGKRVAKGKMSTGSGKRGGKNGYWVSPVVLAPWVVIPSNKHKPTRGSLNKAISLGRLMGKSYLQGINRRPAAWRGTCLQDPQTSFIWD